MAKPKPVTYVMLAGDYQMDKSIYQAARRKVEALRRNDDYLFRALTVWAIHYITKTGLGVSFNPEPVLEQNGFDYPTVRERCRKRELMIEADDHPNPNYLAVIHHIAMGDHPPKEFKKSATHPSGIGKV